MTQDQFYTPPSQEIFDSIKRAAIELWRTFDDTYGYATGKINRIRDIQNVGDNYAYMVAMFDHRNQQKLFNLLDRDDAQVFVADLIKFSRSV